VQDKIKQVIANVERLMNKQIKRSKKKGKVMKWDLLNTTIK